MLFRSANGSPRRRQAGARAVPDEAPTGVPAWAAEDACKPDLQAGPTVHSPLSSHQRKDEAMTADETHVPIEPPRTTPVVEGRPDTVPTPENLPGATGPALPRKDSPALKTALLVDVAADTMTLHTRDAYWLFAGRPWDSTARRILGGQRAASALNALRHLSIAGNPYADWFLQIGRAHV